MPEIVSFDLVGTLTDSYYEEHVWNEAIPLLYSRKAKIPFEKAKEFVMNEYDRMGKSNINWYMPEYWFHRFNLDENPLEVFRSHAGKIRFYPEVPSVLKKLSQKHDLIIASGASRNIIEIVLKEHRRRFKKVYSATTDFHEVQKTPQFYETICRDLEIEPCSMVHIGDEWHSDFITPRSIGVKSFYLDRSGKSRGVFVLRDLRKLQDVLAALPPE